LAWVEQHPPSRCFKFLFRFRGKKDCQTVDAKTLAAV